MIVNNGMTSGRPLSVTHCMRREEKCSSCTVNESGNLYHGNDWWKQVIVASSAVTRVTQPQFHHNARFTMAQVGQLPQAPHIHGPGAAPIWAPHTWSPAFRGPPYMVSHIQSPPHTSSLTFRGPIFRGPAFIVPHIHGTPQNFPSFSSPYFYLILDKK